MRSAQESVECNHLSSDTDTRSTHMDCILCGSNSYPLNFEHNGHSFLPSAHLLYMAMSRMQLTMRAHKLVDEIVSIFGAPNSEKGVYYYLFLFYLRLILAKNRKEIEQTLAKWQKTV